MEPETRALLHCIHSVYQPNKIVLGVAGPVGPFTRTLPSAGRPGFLCTGTACQAPTNDEAKIREFLKAP